MSASFLPLCIVFSACIAFAQSAGTFTATGSMVTPHQNRTATLLSNGIRLRYFGMTDAVKIGVN